MIWKRKYLLQQEFIIFLDFTKNHEPAAVPCENTVKSEKCIKLHNFIFFSLNKHAFSVVFSTILGIKKIDEPAAVPSKNIVKNKKHVFLVLKMNYFRSKTWKHMFHFVYGNWNLFKIIGIFVVFSEFSGLTSFGVILFTICTVFFWSKMKSWEPSKIF